MMVQKGDISGLFSLAILSSFGTTEMDNKWVPCSWGHVTKILLKIFYAMGYNYKNARNGKSISKIP